MAQGGEGGSAVQPAATHRRIRRVLLAVIGVLYLASVPWYRAADGEPRIWLGLPDWVTVAVLCYVAVAVLNAVAWWLTEIDDDGPLPPSLDEGRETDASRSGS